MRLPIVVSMMTLLVLSGAGVSAQTLRQPGQLGASFEVRPSPDGDVYASGAVPQTTVATVEDRHDQLMNRLWIASLFAAVAGTSFDAATSWGLREGNGLLASSDGRFGARGLGIKAGLAAAAIVPQICLRKHKNLKGTFAIGNFTEAGIFAGVSVHNLQVRSASR